MKPRESLMRTVRRSAKYHGHALGPWRKAESLLHGTEHVTECDTCRGIVVIQTNSENTEARVIERTISIPCGGAK